MKHLAIAACILALALGGYLTAAHLSGGAFPTLGLALGGARGHLRAQALSFMEDIQFKDFESASGYHAPEEQAGVDIPYLIERIFLQKPELMDIMDFEVVMADIDSTGLRGRVKLRIKVKDLTNEKLREQELMLFFHREDLQSPWYMKLESSLRPLDAEKGKKH